MTLTVANSNKRAVVWNVLFVGSLSGSDIKGTPTHSDVTMWWRRMQPLFNFFLKPYFCVSSYIFILFLGRVVGWLVSRGGHTRSRLQNCRSHVTSPLFCFLYVSAKGASLTHCIRILLCTKINYARYDRVFQLNFFYTFLTLHVRP